MKRRRVHHKTPAAIHLSVVVMSREKRFHDDVSFLVRNGNCVTLRNVSSLLDKLPGTNKRTTSDKLFDCRLWALFKDDALNLLVDLIQERGRRGGYDMLDDHVKLALVVYGS